MSDPPEKRGSFHPLVPFTCERPTCPNHAPDPQRIGYIKKRWCSNTCRSWGYRQKMRGKGYVRTRDGYKLAKTA